MRTAASALLLLCLLALVFGDEPTYRGKPLDYWIQQRQQGDVPARVLAVKALKAFGAQTDGVLAALTDALDDKASEVRIEAVSALADMGAAAAPAADALAKALRDPRAEVRAKAAAAIGHIGPSAKGATGALAGALSDAIDDPDAAVQAAACAAIESLSLAPKDRAPIATRAARSKSPGVRAWGLKQLAGIGREARDAEQVFIDALADPDAQIRKAAAESLARIGASEKAIPALTRLLEDKAPSVVSAAVAALASLGDKAVPPLMELLQGDEANRWQLAAKAFGEMGEAAKGALPELGKMLRDRDEDFRKRAAATLVRMGPTGKPTLEEAARDKDAVVRAIAQRALAGSAMLGTFAGRTKEGGKLDLVARGGGTRATEVGVRAALGWLARHQSKDGGWRSAGFIDQCDGKPCQGAGDAGYDVGVTGLALLAFLGAGVCPDSGEASDDAAPFGPVVSRALQWILVKEGKDGSFDALGPKQMYNQALATLALAEAYGVTRDDALAAPAQKAVDCLLAAQNPHQAWRYRPQGRENDTSVTAWCVMALKAAQLAGLRVDRQALADACAWVRSVTDPNCGKVGYMSLEDAGQKVVVPGRNEDYAPHEAMAAAGMVVRAFVDGDRADPALEQAARLLTGDMPAWGRVSKTIDYYYWYWGTLALFQYDGPASGGQGRYWAPWNQAVVRALVRNQNTKDSGCGYGSWDTCDRWGFEGGGVYATAINALTLEVYYRYASQFAKGK